MVGSFNRIRRLQFWLKSHTLREWWRFYPHLERNLLKHLSERKLPLRKINVKSELSSSTSHELHSCLTSELDGVQWLTSRPGCFAQYPFTRKLGRPQIRSGRFGDEKYLLTLEGIEPQNLQPLA